MMLQLPADWRECTVGWTIRQLSKQVASPHERQAFDLAMIGACLDLLVVGRESGPDVTATSPTAWSVGDGAYVYLAGFDDASLERVRELVAACDGACVVSPAGTRAAATALHRDMLGKAAYAGALDDFADIRVLFSGGDIGWDRARVFRLLIRRYQQQASRRADNAPAICL